MKISGDPIRYCAAPDKNVRVVLLYGPNRALIEEAVATLKSKLLPKDADDFANVVLNGDAVKDDAQLLLEEWAGFGFFAKKKVIHIKEASDVHARLLNECTQLPDAGHFMILEAEALGPKSVLRAWAEKADMAAAVPCYEFDGPALSRFVQAQFQKQGATILSDAVALLVDRLGGDVSALQGVIAQAIDYVGGDAPKITLETIEKLLVDQAEQELDQAVQSVADVKAEQLDRILYGLNESGVTMIAVTRAVQNYFYRLRTVQAEIKSGRSQEAALALLRPPLFFKVKPHFVRHLNRWPLERIDRVLAECLYLESQCKKTGTPEVALVQQRFLRVMGV